MKHHTKEKGDIAVVKIIADLTVKGFDILLPLSEHLPFDLIAYKDNISHRIQCKYSSDGIAKYKTSWADKNGTHYKKYKDDDFDYFGMYLPHVDKFVYPSIKFKGCTISTQIPNSSVNVFWYEDFFNLTDEALRKTCKDLGGTIIKGPSLKTRKVERPTKEELTTLLWAQPTSQIAKSFGVSDVAISKWAKSYGLTKPPRGYWSKKMILSNLVIPDGYDPSFFG